MDAGRLRWRARRPCSYSPIAASYSAALKCVLPLSLSASARSTWLSTSSSITIEDPLSCSTADFGFGAAGAPPIAADAPAMRDLSS